MQKVSQSFLTKSFALGIILTILGLLCLGMGYYISTQKAESYFYDFSINGKNVLEYYNNDSDNTKTIIKTLTVLHIVFGALYILLPLVSIILFRNSKRSAGYFFMSVLMVLTLSQVGFMIFFQVKCNSSKIKYEDDHPYLNYMMTAFVIFDFLLAIAAVMTIFVLCSTSIEKRKVKRPRARIVHDSSIIEMSN